MPKISTGILLYRFNKKELEFFLVHPGGPFFKNKDSGYWTVPKGEPNDGEDLLECALREFTEETGFSISGDFMELIPVQQKGGKKVYAWALEYNVDAEKISSNDFKMEWPIKSGKFLSFPEIDKASWFSQDKALEKINQAQQSFIQQVAEVLKTKL